MTLKNLKTKFPDTKLRSITTGKTSSSCVVDLACTVGAGSEMLLVPEHNKILMLDIMTGTGTRYHNRESFAVCKVAVQ